MARDMQQQPFQLYYDFLTAELQKTNTGHSSFANVLSALEDFQKNIEQGFYAEELKNHGWDIARSLAPYIQTLQLGPCDEVTLLNGKATGLLRILAEISNPREFVMFSLEYLDSMKTDEDGRESHAKNRSMLFISYGSALSIALRHIRTKKLSAFLNNAFSTVLSYASTEDWLNVDINSSPTNCSENLLQFYFGFLNELLPVIRAAHQLADQNERRRLDALSKYYITSLCETIFSGMALTKRSNDVQQLLDLAGRAEFDVLELLRQSALTSSASIQCLPPLGCSVFVSLAVTDSQYPALRKRSVMPYVLDSVWLFKASLTHVDYLVMDGHSNTAEKGLCLLQVLLWRLDGECFSCGPLSESSGSSLALHTMVETLLNFMATTSNHSQRQLCFSLFKRLMQHFDDSSRAWTVKHMIEESSFPSVQVAGLSVLKDYVHKYWQDGHLDHATRPPSLFMGHAISQTFLKPLFDVRSNIYTSGKDTQHSVLSSDAVLMERSTLLMHVLNLYLYLLMRDSPEVNHTGVWRAEHLDRTSRKLINPLRERVAAVQDTFNQVLHSESQDEEAMRAKLTILLMDNVLERIVERIRFGRKDSGQPVS
ncbi:hypothetical protein BC832DRAFT_595451 [Gaertneriomyces semiglobifer]|nr:hypothetical protein BC832DRAFT_595451 [Gaertneriomyces semiglobifer]